MHDTEDRRTNTRGHEYGYDWEQDDGYVGEIGLIRCALAHAEEGRKGDANKADQFDRWFQTINGLNP